MGIGDDGEGTSPAELFKQFGHRKLVSLLKGRGLYPIQGLCSDPSKYRIRSP
jgi:hypothetical protein